MSTLNSRTASMPSSSPLTPPGVMASWLEPVYSMPFSSNRLSAGRRPVDRKRVAVAGAGVGALQAVVDRAGIQRDQVVEAAAVERQILDLALAHHAGNGGRGGVDHRDFFGDGDLLGELADFEPQVHHGFLRRPPD